MEGCFQLEHIARKMRQAACFSSLRYVHFTVAHVHPLDGAGGPVEAELAADHRGLSRERQNGKVNNTYGTCMQQKHSINGITMVNHYHDYISKIAG